jgi:TRAP-type C4-dicarboxylate transport system permease small subunit
MLRMIKENIRGFLDVTVFMTMIAIGIFAILADYRYFKRVKFQRDAAVALGIGLAYILLSFVFLMIVSL